MKKRAALRYSVVITRGEDDAFVAMCPSIPGCLSQGRTVAEARRNIREAILLCLECYEEDGKAPPKPRPNHLRVFEVVV